MAGEGMQLPNDLREEFIFIMLWGRQSPWPQKSGLLFTTPSTAVCPLERLFRTGMEMDLS